MYKLKYKELVHLTKGKDDVAEKSENKLFKYSELGLDLSNQELADYLRTKTYLLNSNLIEAPPYGLDI